MFKCEFQREVTDDHSNYSLQVIAFNLNHFYLCIIRKIIKMNSIEKFLSGKFLGNCSFIYLIHTFQLYWKICVKLFWITMSLRSSTWPIGKCWTQSIILNLKAILCDNEFWKFLTTENINSSSENGQLYMRHFSEHFGRTTAASQYFLQLAGYLGIPVISWNADNSGFERRVGWNLKNGSPQWFISSLWKVNYESSWLPA